MHVLGFPVLVSNTYGGGPPAVKVEDSTFIYMASGCTVYASSRSRRFGIK